MRKAPVTGAYRGLVAAGLLAVPCAHAWASQPATTGAGAPTDRPPVYEQTFDDARAAPDFVCTDPAAWRLDHGSLWQFATGGYQPAHRSPLNIALLATHRLGSFTLEADVMQTGREYGHRDLCLFFGFQDPEHFGYAHLASAADENAHQVFVVDGAPRTPITTRRTQGVDWGWNEWRHLRVEFDAEAGSVRALVDGEEALYSDSVPFRSGFLGFGSFDDEGRIDNLRVWSDDAQEIRCGAFEPLRPEVRDGAVRFEMADDRVRVTYAGEPFGDYVFRAGRHPYIAPVIGPGAARMTRAYPMEEIAGEAHDHPHHTGLWWAHGDINGHDLWAGDARLVPIGVPQCEDGQINAAFMLETDEGPTGITLGESVRFDELPNGDRTIRFSVNLGAPPGAEVVLGDTKEGTMAIRTHPALRLTPDPPSVPVVTGRAVNSEGVEGKDLWGKRAKWLDYWGQIDGKTVGVAIFDSPRNHAHPTWWHARDYGLIAANPVGDRASQGGEPLPWRPVCAPAEHLPIAYRFYFHRFDTQGARIPDAFERWVERPEKP